MEEFNQNATELAQVIKENTKPEIKSVQRGKRDNAEILLIPEGMKTESLKRYLDEYKEKPDRREGTAEFSRIGSFIKHVNNYKNEESAIFAKCRIGATSISAKVEAIYDYNPKGGDVTAADNGKHRARYDFPVAKDFAYWIENNGKAMSQLDFALFLEERMGELSAPKDEDRALVQGVASKFADPLEILELSRNLEIYASESFVSKNKLSSGETEFKFTATHNDANGKPISIPDFFVIRVPIFEGGEAHRLLCRLRYRKKESVMVWFYDLYRIDVTLNEAFETACGTVEEETGLPLYHGSDEG